MFNQLFKRPYYINRHLKAPFLKERIKYIKLHAEGGCAMQTLRDTAQYLLRIIEFLNLKSKNTVNLKEIDEAADKWAKYQSNHPQKQRVFSIKAKEFFTWHAIKWLRMINKLALPGEKASLLVKIFERGAALKRHANAALLKERLQYLQYWFENGAVKSTIKRIAQYLLVVMRYLNFYKL